MTEAEATPETSPSAGKRAALAFPWLPWPLWALILLLIGAFHRHFAWLVDKGWRNEYYGHGFLIPVVSAYLIYRRWDELRALPRWGFAWGLPLVLAGVALHVVAVQRDVNFPQGFALVTVVAGLAVWLYGWPVARALAFPLAYLLFAVPMGRFLVDRLAQPMQLLSAQAAGGAASFLGVPARVDGTAIILPDYRFEVAVACSGLKSVIALAALGALFAYVVQGPLWKRGALFALSVPAAVAANAFRIWLTLILSRSLGPAVAEGFFHTFSGLVVFVVALLALFGMGSLLGCSRMREDV